jgi:glc operon protein GlcG
MRRTLVLAAALLAATPALAGPAAVTHLDRAKVDAAFAAGGVLVETPRYMIHASRREAAGQAEVHVLDTDLIYVLEGSATFVTGGTMVDPKTTAPNEIRGSAVRDGDVRRITKGDVLVVPDGVPHWFREVDGPVLYYVVKVRRDG